MGWVWNVLLSCSNEEFWKGDEFHEETCRPIERINQWIPGGRLVSLTGPTYANGAGDGMDANLFGGGYKRFDIERFVKVVEAQDWKDRTRVQLWVKGACEGVDEGSFSIIKLRPRSSNHAKRVAKASTSTPKLRTRRKRR